MNRRSLSVFPLTDGLTWFVGVNNSGSSAGTFTVFADCVRKVGKYKVVRGTLVSNDAGTQSTASVACPTGTVPLGGGGMATSTSTAANLNSSIPTSTGWRVDVNNASTGGDAAVAYAICGTKPTGYAEVVGTPASVPAGSQVGTSITCPSGTKVLGGGLLSNSLSTAVNLNSSFPSSSGTWIGDENNLSTAATTETAYAICAKTS